MRTIAVVAMVMAIAGCASIDSGGAPGGGYTGIGLAVPNYCFRKAPPEPLRRRCAELVGRTTTVRTYTWRKPDADVAMLAADQDAATLAADHDACLGQTISEAQWTFYMLFDDRHARAIAQTLYKDCMEKRGWVKIGDGADDRRIRAPGDDRKAMGAFGDYFLLDARSSK